MTFNFTERTIGDVTIKHHSTSNVAEIEFRAEQQKTQGGPLVPVSSTIWIDCGQLEDLINVCVGIKNESTK
jgi:hypothetical protein